MATRAPEARGARAGNGSADTGFLRDRLTWGAYGLVGFFAYLESVLGPIMPFLRAEHHLGYAAASLHFGAFAAGGVLGGLLGAGALERWGRSACMWGGGVGMLTGGLLLAASPVTSGTVAGALSMGIFGSLLLITVQAVLADRHAGWGIVALTESNAIASACAIFASLAVGGFAARGLGWRVALLPPLAALAALAWLLRAEPLGAVRRAERSRAGGHGRLPPRFWMYCAVLFLGVSVEWCMGYWGSDYLDHAVGMSPSASAAGLSVFFAAMLVGRVTVSRLARGLSGDTLLVLALALALGGFPLFWLRPSPPAALVGLGIVGLGLSGVYPLTISLGVRVVPGDTDTATSRLALAGGAALLIAPALLGTVAAGAGIAAAYGIVVPLLLAAAAMALTTTRRSAAA